MRPELGPARPSRPEQPLTSAQAAGPGGRDSPAVSLAGAQALTGREGGQGSELGTGGVRGLQTCTEPRCSIPRATHRGRQSSAVLVTVSSCSCKGKRARCPHTPAPPCCFHSPSLCAGSPGRG